MAGRRYKWDIRAEHSFVAATLRTRMSKYTHVCHVESIKRTNIAENTHALLASRSLVETVDGEQSYSPIGYSVFLLSARRPIFRSICRV